MEITRDVPLRGEHWSNTIESLNNIFTLKNATNYSIFIISLAIGIMYDRTLSISDDDSHTTVKTVPRNVITNRGAKQLDDFFQASILTTETVSLSEEERLKLAFGDDVEFDKLSYLIDFANFGVTRLEGLIGDTDTESMENIRQFINHVVDDDFIPAVEYEE